MNVIKASDMKLLMQKLPDLPWFVQQFIEHKMPDLSPSTLLEYTRDYFRFFTWMIAEALTHAVSPAHITLNDLESLTSEQVDAFKLFLQIQLNNSMSTRERKLASLKSLFHYLSQIAEDENQYPLLKRNVMAKLRTHRLLNPDIIVSRLQGKILEDDEEIACFLNYISSGYSQSISENKQAMHYYQLNRVRDLAIIHLILSSGLRVSEVVNLNVEDLDLNKRVVSIQRKGIQDQTVRQGVYFAEKAKPSLQAYLQTRLSHYRPLKDKALFLAIPRGHDNGKRMSKRAMQQMVSKYANAFGKPYLTIHKLRHSFATSYYLKNDIYKTQRQLGHSSTETTQIYAQLTDRTMSQAIDRLN